MKTLWRKVFDIRAGEGRLVTVLLLHSLFAGIALVFFETAASALFLSRFRSDTLPYAFIGTAITLPFSGVLYNYLRNRVSTQSLWIGTMLSLAAVPPFMAALLYVTGTAWPALVMMMLVNAMYALATLEFWGVAGRVLNVRQTRRLYGLVGSGEAAAGILAGLAVGPILKVITVTMLLVSSGAGFLISLGFLVKLLRTESNRVCEQQDDDESGSKGVLDQLRAVSRDRYIILIIGMYALYNLTHETLEYTVLSQIQSYFHQNETHVAVFIGALLSIRQLFGLIGRIVFSGWLLTRFGLGLGLAATPALIIAGSLSMAVLTMGASFLPLFWLVVVLKIGEGTMRNALGEPALMVACRPLAPERRDRAQMLMETAIEPLSTGLAGTMLVLVNFASAGASDMQRTMGTGFLLLTLGCGWLAMARLVRREYVEVLKAAVSRGRRKFKGSGAGRLEGVETGIQPSVCGEDDDDAVPALESLLSQTGGTRGAQVRAIRVLGRIGTPTAIACLKRYISDPALRQHTIHALAMCSYRASGPDTDLVDAEFRREIERAAALNAALLDIDTDAHAALLANSLRSEITRSQEVLFSLVSFLYNPESVEDARRHWRSGSDDEKALAIEALDNLCQQRHRALLLPLIEDHHPGLAYAKLNGQFPQPRLGPRGRLLQILTVRPEWASAWMRVWALDAVERAPGAVEVLDASLSDPDPLVREQAALALARLRGRAEDREVLSMIEKVSALKSMAFFQTTGDELLEELASLGTEVSARPGEQIISEGNPERSIYIALRGHLRVHDAERATRDLNAPCIFGELAPLDSEPQSAAVIAKSDVILLKLDRAVLVDVMTEQVEVAQAVIRAATRCCRPADEQHGAPRW